MHPPVKGAQRTKAPKNLLSCANRPYTVRAGLIDAAHVAIVQAHVTRARRIARAGSTRPIVARPHADKRVPIDPLALSVRI